MVTVTTAPKNTDEEKYQMDGVPTYTDEDGKRQEMAYQTGGTYSFIMPEHDTELSAVYKKVAASVRIEPEEYLFRVVQERTGDRKNPSVTTEVRDGADPVSYTHLDVYKRQGGKDGNHGIYQIPGHGAGEYRNRPRLFRYPGKDAPGVPDRPRAVL